MLVTLEFFQSNRRSQKVFELSTLCTHTCCESLSPFIDSRVNDVLLHTIPDSNEALLQLIDVVHTTFVHTLLHHSPDLVINRV